MTIAIPDHRRAPEGRIWQCQACDMPDCTGPRQILLMEPAMRCICRRCWRMMGDDA